MKLYYINPNNYGAEYFTIAKNPSEALLNLKTYLHSKTILSKTDPEYCYIDQHIEKYNEWKGVIPNNLPHEYTIEEYEEGEVIESEIS